MTIHLPDPRRFAASSQHPLSSLARTCLDALDENQSLRLRRQLTDALRDHLEQGQDRTLLEALKSACSAPVYRLLWEGLTQALEEAGRPGSDETLFIGCFAFPIVWVTAGPPGAVIPGVLPNPGAIVALLDEAKAVGRTRNFGLSNSLASLEFTENLSPSAMLAWSRGLAGTPASRDIPPADLRLSGAEETHLRFLVGAGVSPADAPSFLATGSRVAAWGRAMSRELGSQLGQPGVSLVALPRPPRPLLEAAYAGRRIQLEAAFQLFVSGAVRNIRAATGDPDASLAAHADGEIRVTLSSPFEAGVGESFRWPLHPLDDVDEIATDMVTLLQECRIPRIEVHPELTGVADAALGLSHVGNGG